MIIMMVVSETTFNSARMSTDMNSKRMNEMLFHITCCPHICMYYHRHHHLLLMVLEAERTTPQDLPRSYEDEPSRYIHVIYMYIYDKNRMK